MQITVKAENLREGDWIVYASNPRQNTRVVEVQAGRDGEVKVYHDFGNGGEPAVSYFDNDDKLTIKRG